MIQKRTRRAKPQHVKTQINSETQITLMQFGKPVKLPNIHKKIYRYQNDMTNSRSIEARNSMAHNQSLKGKPNSNSPSQQINLRKYSNNSQLHLLTLQQMQLCSQRSKKFLPKIAGMANCFVSTRQNTDYFDREQFMRRLSRMKSQKRIQTSFHEQQLINNYKLDCVIGRGSYSIVRLAYYIDAETATTKKCAIKIYNKSKINSPQRQSNLQKQISIMKQIQHNNIIKFKQQIQTEDQIYLIMQLFENCSLGDYLKKSNHGEKISQKKFGEIKLLNDGKSTKIRNQIQHKSQGNNKNSRAHNDQSKNRIDQFLAKNIFNQIVESIFYLHNQKNIVHRDIKLDNILIQAQTSKIKIIDFGFSCFDDGNIWHQDYCGTPHYISPQIFRKQGYKGKPADVWALGVLLYYLIAGTYPFKSPSQSSDFAKIQLKGQPLFSEDLKKLLEKMLQNNPEHRSNIEQVLKSKWLQQK